MSSDSEIDGIERFQNARQEELYAKAGLDRVQHEDLDMSDEEVMGIESDAGIDEDDEGQEQYYEQAAAEKDNDENWGDTRDNYFGGEDDLGADEGASEEEEEEALRLQQKQLAEMEDADFVDEDDLEGWKHQATTDDLGVAEDTQALDASSMTAEERRELIETKFPVILLLSNELEKCRAWEQELSSDTALDEDLRRAGESALQTYTGMIYAFFALFAERVNQGNTKGLSELEEHPVHEGILTARQLWQDFQKAKAAHSASAYASRNGTGYKAEAEHLSDAESSSDGDVYDSHARAGHQELQASQSSDGAASDAAASDFSVSDLSASEQEPASASVSASEDDEFSIAKPTAKRPKAQQSWNVVGDYDEAADTIEQQQRAKSKQSLRFYTSQIGKNDASKKSENIGDMDVPYREREFERRQRLMQAAQKRGQEARDRLGDDDEMDSFNMDGDASATENLDGGSERHASGYAQMKHQRESTKEKRRKEYSDAREAVRAGRVADFLAENPNADKRAINYQIEKNKGLTPKRKKENRNARVKKRMRYEAAQKKLKGVRKVYEEPKGPYQGELTGIRKNLVHSNKFKN